MAPSTSAPPDAALALLDTEHAALRGQLDRVPAARRADRPAPARWSSAEVAEHVARVESSVAKLFAKRAAAPVFATPAEIAAAALTPPRVAGLRNRAVRIEAPEWVVPTGSLSADAALDQLTAAHAALRAAYEATPATVLDGCVHVHPILGPLTLRDWMATMAHHEARHAEQVAELANDLAPGA
jgi:hypothetical protein